MTTFFPIDLLCPICDTKFKSQSVGSCGFASKRTDFRPNYGGANPVNYFYHNCPKCGFCGTQNSFDMKIDDDKFKEKIKTMGPLEKNEYEHNLSIKIERAMLCLELMNEYEIIDIDDFSLANNWINAYWWASKKEEEKEFAEIVLDYFDKAFNKDQIPKDRILEILYLRGEINRRIGNFEKANELFDGVIKLAKDKEELNDIASLATQQKTEPKENL